MRTQIDAAGIDPVRMATCLEVLAELEDLPVDHPDALAVQPECAGRKRVRVGSTQLRESTQ